jgi:hypothetical protein
MTDVRFETNGPILARSLYRFIGICRCGVPNSPQSSDYSSHSGNC